MFASGAGSGEDGLKDSLRNIEANRGVRLQPCDMGKPRTDEPDISLGAQGRKRIGNDGIDVAAGTAGGRALGCGIPCSPGVQACQKC